MKSLPARRNEVNTANITGMLERQSLTGSGGSREEEKTKEEKEAHEGEGRTRIGGQRTVHGEWRSRERMDGHEVSDRRGK
jgi:hypothetical protein